MLKIVDQGLLIKGHLIILYGSRLREVTKMTTNYPPLWGIYRKNVGASVDTEQYEKATKARQKITAQSLVIAHRLEQAGFPAITQEKIAFIGAITGRVEFSAGFRPICFIPEIAKQKRNSMLRDLEYFQANHEGARWMRYMVITNGQPVKVERLGNAIRKLNRKVSKWAHEIRKEYGIDVVFRGLEFPLKDKGKKAHLHANILFIPKQRLSNDRFSEFLEFTHGYFGTVLKDAGVLKEPREAIKYPFKPNDLDDAGGDQLRAVAEATLGQRITEALGAFRDFRRMLNDKKLRTVWDTDRLILAQKAKRETKKDHPEDDLISAGGSNRLVGILPPVAFGSMFKEPVLMIQGDVQTVLETDESLRITCFEFRRWWDDNGAPPVSFNLDNKTLSVPAQLQLINTELIKPVSLSERQKVRSKSA